MRGRQLRFPSILNGMTWDGFCAYGVDLARMDACILARMAKSQFQLNLAGKRLVQTSVQPRASPSLRERGVYVYDRMGFILHTTGTDRHLIESHGRHAKVK